MISYRIRIASVLGLAMAGCAVPAPMPGRATRTPVSVSPSARLEAPVLVRKKNGHYRVARPWTVRLGRKTWHVQKGYTSNGITAPGFIKSSLGDGVRDPETWAAVFHDWLFTQPGMSRSEADRLFHEILRAYGVPDSKAELMYSAVRAYSASKSLR